jgi:hypothetical protein
MPSDAMLTRRVRKTPGARYRRLRRLLVIAPATHRLARKKSVTGFDLAGESFILRCRDRVAL